MEGYVQAHHTIRDRQQGLSLPTSHCVLTYSAFIPQKYLQFELKSFVQSNPNVKWYVN